MKKKIIIISSIVAILAVGGISGAVIYTNSNKDVDTSVNVAENDIDENEVDETVIDEEESTIEAVEEEKEKRTTEEKGKESSGNENKKKDEKNEASRQNTTTDNATQTVETSKPSESTQSVPAVSQTATSQTTTTSQTTQSSTPATTQAPTTEHVHNYVASTKTIHHDAVTHWEVHNITNTGFDFEAHGINPYEWFTLSDGSMGSVFEWVWDSSCPYSPEEIGCGFGNRNVEVVDSPAWDETVTVYTCECGDSYTK